MSHKSIAISGASGFLGKQLIELLRTDDYKLALLTRRDISKIEKKAGYLKTDYSVEDLRNKLKGIDAFVHLAANRNSIPKISFYHDNETLSQNIFEACKNANIKHIVFASSISVYSNKDKIPWKENQKADPLNFYGISKLAIENIGSLYSRHYNLFIKSLRFAHLFGANEDNNYMINIFMRNAFNKKKLHVNNSDAKREFLYVKDAARAIVSVLFAQKSGVYNVGSNDYLTNLEVAQKINKAFKNTNNILIEKNENNIDSSYMDKDKIKKEFGFVNAYNFDQAMQDIYRELRKNYNV